MTIKLSVLLLAVLIPVSLAAQGVIVTWGEPECTDPEDNGGFVAVSCDERGTACLFLKSDGSIVAWNSLPVPELHADAYFVAIAMADDHCLALKGDGSIVAWGDNSVGQCDVPPPNTDFIAIAATSGVGPFDQFSAFSFGIKSDGQIVKWGSGYLEVPSPNIGYQAIAADCDVWDGASLNCSAMAIDGDGSIVRWGWWHHTFDDVPQPNVDFVDVDYSRFEAVGVREDGTGEGWGNYAPASPQIAEGLVAVSVSHDYYLGLTAAGRVAAWGWTHESPPVWRDEPAYYPVSGNDFIAIEAGWTCHHVIRDAVTSVEDNEASTRGGDSTESVPQVASLEACFPNPFNPRTVVPYVVGRNAVARVAVYDMTGRLVAVLADRHHPAGRYTVAWDGLDHGRRSLPSGTYVIRLTAAGEERATTVVLIR